jgi:FkbM family methyltransferase
LVRTAPHLGRLYPLKSGSARLAQYRLARWFTPRSATAVARLSNGMRIEIFPNDYIGSAIQLFGDYDPKISWVCRRVLRRGDVAIDVGAHHGLISLFAAGAVGPTGTVHAFEPQPELAATLRQSLRLNSLSNVHLHELALSDRDGRMTLNIPAFNTGAASFSDDVVGVERRIEVEVRQAATYLASLNCPAPRLLKLDVEGHEDRFFRAAEPFFRDTRPTVVVFECHANGTSFWQRDAVRILRGLDYTIYQVPKAVLRVRLRELNVGVEPPASVYDFVAVTAGAQNAEVLRSLRVRQRPVLRDVGGGRASLCRPSPDSSAT